MNTSSLPKQAKKKSTPNLGAKHQRQFVLNDIRHGTVIQLGRHRLLCGSATDKAQVESFLHNETIDLILTDPPYGVAVVESQKSLSNEISTSDKNTKRTKRMHKSIVNDQHQTADEFAEFSRQWLAVCASYLAEKNSYYIFNADPHICSLKAGLIQAGYNWKQLLIWAKTSASLSRLDYLSQHELIAYGWRGKHCFRRTNDKSILIQPKTQKNTLHPTMKPVGLLRRLILNSSQVSQTIYDPFGGSGSTLIACEQTQRRCLMVELDPEYCRVICQRWEQLTGDTVTYSSL